MTQFQVHLRKQALKFSAAHMTVFPNGTKEALHGHNYFTEITIELPKIDLPGMISFADLKSEIKKICDQWDEKVLLASQCPFFELVSKSAQEMEFKLCGKRYILPSDEVELLPLDNITSESLAFEFCRRLALQWKPEISQGRIRSFSVRIEESPGQGASCFWDPSKKATP